MNPIKKVTDFQFREDPGDPFIARMHHVDCYPPGDENQYIRSEDLEGITLGEDFNLEHPFKMYYGDRVPGFPVHSHRGFETVTVVLRGFVDHHDSNGEKGRYGAGDVQWMTAGKGIRHSEMFPLVHSDEPNTCELFQIWVNLPQKNKMVDSSYKMLWREAIPVVEGEGSKVAVLQGEYAGEKAPEPIVDSWAAHPEAKFRILRIDLEEGGEVVIDAVSDTLNRNLYLYEGGMTIDGQVYASKKSFKLYGDREATLVGGPGGAKLILMEAVPIGEPMINDGPMVMTMEEEICQGYKDFQKNKFGNWPWNDRDPILPPGSDRG